MKQMMRLFWFFSIVAMIGIYGADLTPAAGDEAVPEKVFVGYLFGQPSRINFGFYTHLCHAFVTADEEGSIQKARNVPNGDIVGQAHKTSVRILISLGGWRWDKQFGLGS